MRACLSGAREFAGVRGSQPGVSVLSFDDYHFIGYFRGLYFIFIYIFYYSLYLRTVHR